MTRSSGPRRKPLVVLAASGVALCFAVDAARSAGLHSTAPDRSGRVQAGAASFYSRKEAGKPTASGAPLALAHMTAASPTLPLGSKAKVINTRNGQAAQVTITDRGPYAKGRVLDVTPKAAERLGIAKKDGTAPVKVKPIAGSAPPVR